MTLLPNLSHSVLWVIIISDYCNIIKEQHLHNGFHLILQNEPIILTLFYDDTEQSLDPIVNPPHCFIVATDIVRWELCPNIFLFKYSVFIPYCSGVQIYAHYTRFCVFICRLWLNEQQPWHYYLLCEAPFVYFLLGLNRTVDSILW